MGKGFWGKRLQIKNKLLVCASVAFIVVFTYFGIETFCVKTGRDMPFQRVSAGGECMSYSGVFWHIMILCPLSDASSHRSPSTKMVGFSLPVLILTFVGVTFALWLLLKGINFLRNLIISCKKGDH